MSELVFANRARTETKFWESPYFKSFFYALCMSFLLFIPFIVVDGGRFLYYGDFNVQQIAFYRMCHDSIRAGNLGWSHLTDLGANFVGSYTFYLLGSPFFWLTIPFPSAWVQYLIGPLLMLKLSCCSLTAYLYLQRYVKNKDYAIVGALLYAFSGYSSFNLFFNHFHEAMVFFPLLLWSLDEYMYNRRRGLFAACVGVCCLVNYYFFVGMVVFCVIYWALRMACKSWKISVKDFLLLALEAVVGLGLSCLLLFPSVLAVLQNNRVDSTINGWGALLYGDEQKYLHIFSCFFFPPDIPARANITPDSNAKWASIGAWLPLFGMSGVIGFLQLRRKHWLKKFLWILFLMAMVPGLNALFQLLNAAYYARWFYMLTLMMALATVLALENTAINWPRAIGWTAGITVAIAVAVGLTPKISTKDGQTTITMGLETWPSRFWSYVAIALCSLALLVYIFQFYRQHRQQFVNGLLLGTAFVSVIYSAFIISLGKTQIAYTWDHLIPYELNGGADVELEDLREVRSDFYESVDNAGMFWQTPTIQAFHSIVPGSVMEFYKSIGVPRDVASRPEISHFALRGLTSVKYLFDSLDDDKLFGGEEWNDPQMPGWTYLYDCNGYGVWENEYYIPMGFTYTDYVTRAEYDDLGQNRREQLMLKAIVLDEEQEAAYGELYKHGDTTKYIFTKETYLTDCEARAKETCSSFVYTNSGFEAEIQTKRETLVFFSVPYEDGWSAEVNGKPVAVEQVNVGFMAVPVPKGESRIVFTYRTPGLKMGAVVTAGSAFVLVVYLLIAHFVRKQPKQEKTHRVWRKAAPFSAYKKQTGATFSSVPTQAQVNEREAQPMEVLPDLPVEDEPKHTDREE